MLKRAALVVLLATLIGAAMNFPVAMWCAKSRMQSPLVPIAKNVNGPEAAAYAWPAPTPQSTPWPSPSQFTEFRAFGYRRVQVLRAAIENGSLQGTHSMEVEYTGWPLPCVRRVQMWWPWNDPAWTSSQEPDPKPQVVWSGAIGNPVLLGVSVWLVLVMPFEAFLLIRRRRRYRRRACLGCGYPAGSAGVCTECGKPLPASYASGPTALPS
jgi:hypothetical protein